MSPRRTFLYSAAVVAVLGVAPALGVAHRLHAAGAPPHRVEVSFQDTSAFPGGQLTVAIELKLSGQASVTALDVSARIPEGTTFSSAALAYAVQAANGSLVGGAAIVDEPTRTVTVRIRTREAMPVGVVAYLVFDMPGNTELGRMELTPTEVAVSGPAGRIEPVKTTTATIAIIDPKSVPIPGCFFYMH